MPVKIWITDQESFCICFFRRVESRFGRFCGNNIWLQNVSSMSITHRPDCAGVPHKFREMSNGILYDKRFRKYDEIFFKSLSILLMLLLGANRKGFLWSSWSWIFVTLWLLVVQYFTSSQILKACQKNDQRQMVWILRKLRMNKINSTDHRSGCWTTQKRKSRQDIKSNNMTQQSYLWFAGIRAGGGGAGRCIGRKSNSLSVAWKGHATSHGEDIRTNRRESRREKREGRSFSISRS